MLTRNPVTAYVKRLAAGERGIIAMFIHNNKIFRGDDMPNNHLRRVAATLGLMLALPALAAESCPLPPAKIASADAAVTRAAKAIGIYRIGKLKPECMALVANKQKSGYLVDVREIHNDACGGDPMTEPRAFSIDVAWDGKMKSDVYDHLNYLPLSCPKA